MTYDQTKYPSAANLIGNTSFPRNTNPMVRSGARRLDPDNTSNAPYYANANSKVLRVNYTTEVSSVVTPATHDITLLDTSLAAIISDINVIDPTNLQALDLDGFLTLKNLNPGKTHYLEVAPYTTTPANDAAPVLGFVSAPLPGSRSYAGELAATPGSRKQSNPQTAELLANDDALAGSELNRAFVATLQMIENLRAEVSRDIISFKDVVLTVAAHPITTGKFVARINDDTLRLYCPPSATGSFTGPGDLFEPFFRVMHNPSGVPSPLAGSTVIAEGVAGYPTLKIVNIYYATTSTSLSTTPFATWGTPDGGSACASTIANKDKQAATAISSIRGNIITCSGALFVTNKIKRGDPIELVASNLQPFDHSGWFTCDDVVDETNIVVRPMALSTNAEASPTVKNRPRFLNPVAGGTLRVAVGHFLPAGNLWLEFHGNRDQVDTGSIDLGTYVVRIPIGTSFRDVAPEGLNHTLPGYLDDLSALLYAHVAATANAHAATAISGFTTGPWNDAETSTGANLQVLINDIVSQLKEDSDGAPEGTNSGAKKIGSEIIVGSSPAGGMPPTDLPHGSIWDQISNLLLYLTQHVNDGVAHAGAGAPYGGSSNWKDGNHIASGITINDAISQIVSDLAAANLTGASGAAKVGISNRTNWNGGRTNPGNVSILDAINKIITDLGDTATSDDGAERIGAQATTDLAVGTLRSQLDAIAAGWGKLTRAQTWSAKQTMNGTASDTVAAIDTSYTPSLRKLLWEAPLQGGTQKMRIYAGLNDIGVGFEVTVNARWDGTNWNREVSGEATRMVLAKTGLYLQQRLSGDSGTWTDTLGNWHTPLVLAAENPSSSSAAFGPSVVPANVCRAHGHVVVGASSVTSQHGVNMFASLGGSLGTETLVIGFTTSMPDANYTVNLTMDGPIGQWMQIQGKSASGFSIVLFSSVGGGASVLNNAFNFSVFAGV